MLLSASFDNYLFVNCKISNQHIESYLTDNFTANSIIYKKQSIIRSNCYNFYKIRCKRQIVPYKNVSVSLFLV